MISTQQTFKMNSKELKKYRANLRTWFRRATDQDIVDGVYWYEEAQEFSKQLSNTFNVSPFRVAAVISALSPANKWSRNKIDTVTVFLAATNGLEPKDFKVCTYNSNKIKALRIAKGELNITDDSPKTYAFAQNIGNMSSDHVTIDRWHLRACQTTSLRPRDCKMSLTTKQYKAIQDATVQVAKEYNLKGYEFQAIVWLSIKNAWER